MALCGRAGVLKRLQEREATGGNSPLAARDPSSFGEEYYRRTTEKSSSGAEAAMSRSLLQWRAELEMSPKHRGERRNP